MKHELKNLSNCVHQTNQENQFIMKKYFPLILFYCLGYSVNISAQTLLFDNSFSPIGGLNIADPSLNTIDFNTISNYHFFNPYAFNPAMAGIEDKRQFNVDWNRQINHSASISYEQPIATFNSAIGIQYEYSNKEYGKIHSYGLAYNYGFHWKENSQLRIGMQFSQVNIKVNRYSSFTFEEDTWHSFPSVDFGLAFQHKQLRLGASVQNLVPKEFVNFNEFTESYINQGGTKRTLNLSAANIFQLSKKWDWSVALLLRFYNNEIVDGIVYDYTYPYPCLLYTSDAADE